MKPSDGAGEISPPADGGVDAPRKGGRAPSAGRVLGLDVGDRTIGMAVSDPLGWTAQGMRTLRRKGGDADLQAVAREVREHGVGCVVVGLPRNMNGTFGPRAAAARAFIRDLSAYVPAPIVEWDERLTTLQAEKLLIEGGVHRKKRRGVIDTVAAVLILQSYLDAHRAD